jgi:Retrotransposon gag protein/Zinc knuckle
VKPPKPEKYRGGPRVASWLFAMEQYFFVLGILADNLRIAVAGSYLAGSALDWWRLLNTQAAAGLAALPSTWIQFKIMITERFQPIEEAAMARQRMRALTQRGSVRKYITDFNNLVLRIPSMDEDTRLDNFIFGLRQDVRRWVRQQRPARLIDAIRLAEEFETIRLQDVAADRSLAKKGSNLINPLPPPRGPAADNGPTPMELGSAQISARKQHVGASRSPAKPKTQQAQRTVPTCFKCGQPGHIKRFCTERKKSSPKTKVNSAQVEREIPESDQESNC